MTRNVNEPLPDHYGTDDWENTDTLTSHLHGDEAASDLPTFTRLDAVSVKSYRTHPAGHVVYWTDYKALLDHLLPYKKELLKLSEQVGETNDPFAIWETVAALQVKP